MKCVVAKYKEDVSWIKNYDLDYYIYNKDNEDHNFELNSPNIGRESETYIRFILDNYDILNERDKILFLQGNPFDHLDIEEFESFIPKNGFILNKNHLPQPFCKRWSYVHYSNVFICYKNGIHNKFNTPADPMKSWNMTSDACEYLNLPLNHFLVCYTGAQWLVPVKYIKNKSKKWWENAQSMHYLKSEIGIVAPYLFERLWEKIWYHSDIEG